MATAEIKMTPNRPYLLRAFYEWILDNQLTPHIVVDATVAGVQVPQEHVRDGQIVLNISPNACGKMDMGNVDVRFEARFGGVARQLIVPCTAILAIYARENGAGSMFADEEELTENSTDSVDNKPEPTPPPKGRPNLKVIK